jgi:hypothetical protein
MAVFRRPASENTRIQSRFSRSCLFALNGGDYLAGVLHGPELEVPDALPGSSALVLSATTTPASVKPCDSPTCRP